jgi:GABA permease
MRRLLVVANETIEGEALHETIRERAAEPGSEVLVVAPALNTRLRHWMSDSDAARRAAEARLVACLERLDRAHVHARGWIGDADPLAAIDDALRLYSADEIVIATHPEKRSNWLAHDLVGRARERFDQPVLHVVVDVVRHEEYVAA